MRGLISLLAAAVIAFFVYKLYVSRSPTGEGGVPAAVQAITTTGVKNDLLAIAQAERGYFAEHASYATLDELISTSALSMTKPGRDGYSYSVEITTAGYVATARYQGPAKPPLPSFRIDQTLRISTVE